MQKTVSDGQMLKIINNSHLWIISNDCRHTNKQQSSLCSRFGKEVDKDINLRWLFKNVRSELNSVCFLRRFNKVTTSKKCKRNVKRLRKVMAIECCGHVVPKQLCNEFLSVRKNTWLEGSP